MEIAYLAGLIDGEGCIVIKKNKSTNRLYNYSLRLTVQMYHKDVIYAIYCRFGGNIHILKNKIWFWDIGGLDAGDLLKELLPYLIVKKEQAELALNFLKTFEYSRTSNMIRSVEERHVQDEYYKMMQLLKEVYKYGNNFLMEYVK